MFHLFCGSLAILAWKCGTQLLTEVRHIDKAGNMSGVLGNNDKKKSKFTK